MTCPNVDPALVVERLRTRFRGQVLDTFLLYLFTYEMPIDRCRLLLEKVESQALRGFPDLAHASWRAEAAEELRDRLVLVENSAMKKIEERYDRQQALSEPARPLSSAPSSESPSGAEIEPPGKDPTP